MELQVELAAQVARGRERRPVEVTALFDRCIDDIRAQGVADRALSVGAPAPTFTLPDAHGRDVRLADLLPAGPVVITFYRGGWCPYCNLELRAYAERMSAFDTAGVQVVAISPQLPDESLTQVKRDELPFMVLSDRNNAAAATFGIVHAVPAELETVYIGSGHDVAGKNGQVSGQVSLPLPATFIVDRSGIIRFVAVSADYTDRADPDEVLAVASTLD